jgi:hypothetical protein
LIVGACGGQIRIDSATLEAIGDDLGASSSALVTLEGSAGDEAIRDASVDLGADLVALVIAHDAWTLYEGPVPEAVGLALEVASPGYVDWDGDVLDAELTTEEGAAYALSLAWRRGVIRSDFSGEEVGDGEVDGESVFLPPFVDGVYELSTIVDVGGTLTEVRLLADYVGLTLDGNHCAAGGGVDISYRLSSEGTDRGGFVRSSYHGCGRIQVFTR